MEVQRPSSWYEPPALPPVIARCAQCKAELTHLDDLVILDEHILCDDSYCIYQFLNETGRLRRVSSVEDPPQ
jgi:hypothetical protein